MLHRRYDRCCYRYQNVALKELPVYVVIAAVLSLVVIELTSTSFVVPILFLLSIGLAILYNLGSNVFLGETSYITKALTAVLQLGVTMDYSIFLLNSFEENKSVSRMTKSVRWAMQSPTRSNP